MESLENPVIDFPIERINRFLKTHTFEVPLHYDVLHGINLPMKVKLTGMKNFISTGDWKSYIVYEFHVIPGTKVQNFMASIYYGKEDVTELPVQISLNIRNTDSLLGNLNELLRNFLRYWGVNYGVTCGGGYTHVPYNIEPDSLKEL
jgi:hypothetical protein